MRSYGLTALVLNVRPYRETSAMVQMFCREQGRFTGVIKGLRKRKVKTRVEPFIVASVNTSGRSGLANVTSFESQHEYALHGDAISGGFYALELITRALAEYQVESRIFDATLAVLMSLETLCGGQPSAVGASMAPSLREFETILLRELGYGLDYYHEALSGDAIQPDALYEYVDESGFARIDESLATPSAPSANPRFAGADLLAIGAGEYDVGRRASMARVINQRCLAHVIGHSPLVSRSLLPNSSRKQSS